MRQIVNEILTTRRLSLQKHAITGGVCGVKFTKREQMVIAAQLRLQEMQSAPPAGVGMKGDAMDALMESMSARRGDLILRRVH